MSVSDDSGSPHERWLKRLRRTWPEAVPAHWPSKGEKLPASRKDNRPWPKWFGDQRICRECFLCAFYIELSGELGAAWGACKSETSQYDGQLVFEHWTCNEWRYREPGSFEFDESGATPGLLSYSPERLKPWAEREPLEVRRIADGRTVALLEWNSRHYAALVRTEDGTPLFLDLGISRKEFEDVVETLSSGEI